MAKIRTKHASVLAVAALAVAGLALFGFAGSGSAARQAAPSNTSPPKISGTEKDGETLHADHGDWSQNPSNYDYRWQRCDQDGSNCDDISGATDNDYKLTSDDVGHRARVVVTATNPDGKSSAASAPTGVINAAGSKPVNASPPTITGTPQDNQTLTALTGSWGGSDPKTYTYAWRLCDANGNNCSNTAKEGTYKVTSHDVGHRLRVVVTAKNNAGSASAESAPTAVVKAASSSGGGSSGGGGGGSKPSTSCKGSGTVNVKDIAPPIRLLVSKWQFSPSVVNRGTRTIAARILITDTCNHAVAGVRVWATAIPYNQVSVVQATTGNDGYATLTFTIQRGFPANPGRQQIMAMLVRATDPSGSALAGKSTRRVLELKVNAR